VLDEPTRHIDTETILSVRMPCRRLTEGPHVEHQRPSIATIKDALRIVVVLPDGTIPGKSAPTNIAGAERRFTGRCRTLQFQEPVSLR